MNGSVPVPFDLFRRLFESQIRVWLDWNRLTHERCEVELAVADKISDVAHLYAPWYLAAGGTEVGFREPGATPIRLVDIPSVIGRLDARRGAAIQQLAGEVARYKRPVQFPAVVYSVGKDAGVVVDGNHRIAASLLSRKPFSILAFCIQGPVDAAVLPDLTHWHGRTG